MGFPKPVAIVSLDQEYLRDKRLLSRFGLFGDLEELENNNLVELLKIENVNDPELLEQLNQRQCNIGFSISCRNIIKKPLIDFFRGAIFNLHDSYLPDERGGGLNSWRILNDVRDVGDTIHFLDEGIDSGRIILRSKLPIDATRPTPIDYHLTSAKNCETLISKFLKLIVDCPDPCQIPAIEQEHDQSDYFPRLFTEQNGLINWDWSQDMIERFIRAFSTPYPGAYSFYKSKKLHILASRIDPEDKKTYHPFCNGQILTICRNGEVRVAAGQKTIRLIEVSVENVKMNAADILDARYSFSSPPIELDQAKRYIPTTKEMNIKEE
jgi:methionyl-tRNA formyltransferase